MTNGFNYETMTCRSYEDFFYSFMSESQLGGIIEGKLDEGYHHLFKLHLTYNHLNKDSILTNQEYGFIKKMIYLSGKEKGTEPGQDCNRYGCIGAIKSKAEDYMSCTCFNMAPCAKCMAGTYCPECDWDSDED